MHWGRFLVSILASWFLLGQFAMAGEIRTSQITPSTNLSADRGTSLSQINDGIVDPQKYNKNIQYANKKGFISDVQQGVITLKFDKLYDVTGFRLWNDVVVYGEGVKTFKLKFYGKSGQKLVVLDQMLAARAQLDVQEFDFPHKIEGVAKVDLIVTSVFKAYGNFIEIREVEFVGEPSIVSPSINWLIPAIGAAGLLAASLLLRNVMGGKNTPAGSPENLRVRPRPRKPNDEHVVFAQSAFPMSAITPGPPPVAPLGHTMPSGLQTLTGQYAALRPAYKATGRIGFAQEGVPTNDDVSLGTGFLITPRHVMTNQHVWETYKQYLHGDECGGIEFIAERDRDHSDYYEFDGQPPLVLPELDIAIFRLTRGVTDRTPIDRVAVPASDLDTRDVVLVGYPCPFEVDEVTLSAVEPDPIFAVKRLSQGQVFRHSTDTDAPFGIMFKVDALINSGESLQAVCHNASTLPGHSGSPVLCARTGELLGVHFAGSRSLFGEEAANLAMAIEFVASAEAANKGKFA